MPSVKPYPSVPWHLKLFRGALGLPTEVPKPPARRILLELKTFILCFNEPKTEAIIEKGIAKALAEGSPDLQEYLQSNRKCRPDHIANALHLVLPKELHQEIEDWVTDIAWSTDWQNSYNKFKNKPNPQQAIYDDEINKNSTGAVLAEISDLPGSCQSFLEAGFGSGKRLLTLAKILPHIDFHGIDLTTDAVKILTSYAQKFGVDGNLHAQTGDFFKMNFPDGKFDITYNMGVLEHFDEAGQLALIKEMARVTRRGGRLLIGVPNMLSPGKIMQMSMTGVDWRNVKNRHSYMLWPYRYEAPMAFWQMRSLCKNKEVGLRVLGFRGWDPFNKMCRDNKMKATLDWLLNGEKPKPHNPGMLAPWDWVNADNKESSPARWQRVGELNSSRQALFTVAMYYMGWLGQKLLVNPLDFLTRNAVSHHFGEKIMIIAEKP